MEQPQYNLFHRQRVEQEYARLYKWLQDTVTNPDGIAATERLRPISEELGCTLSQLAIALGALAIPVSAP